VLDPIVATMCVKGKGMIRIYPDRFYLAGWLSTCT